MNINIEAIKNIEEIRKMAISLAEDYSKSHGINYTWNDFGENAKDDFWDDAQFILKIPKENRFTRLI